jgi:Protein of unknown function (DUF4058)
VPLLDHFHPPLNARRHWQGFHSAWANALVDQLNQGLLPENYFAEPNVQWGARVEVDVATFEEGAAGPGGATTAVWAPPAPPLVAALDVAALDTVEVQVFEEEEGPRLVAAIELVSPANKDRATHRHAFAVKYAAYLLRQIGLVVVDAVTSRAGALHAELLQLLGVTAPPAGGLFAAAYRAAPAAGGLELHAWPAPLTVGTVLPTVPLCLSADLALPLDLEASYAAACARLRIGGS